MVSRKVSAFTFCQSSNQPYFDFCDRLALRRLLPKQGGKIIDVCGGFGRLSGEYVDRFKQSVLFDYAPKLLEQAKAAYGNRLQTVQETVYAMPFATGTFDALLLIRAAHHLTDFNAAVSELARVLKNGGIAIIEIDNKGETLHHVEQVFLQNNLQIIQTLAVSGLRRHINGHFLQIWLLHTLEYFLQYTIGRLKWSSSIFYRLQTLL